jgi:eukaryotic-like serine/threonine-protein kinase
MLALVLASRPLGEMLPRVGATVDRYHVLAELAHGGMAAIYVVRRTAIGGFDKLLALKVLLPHLRSDRKFVDMFLDEARIASLVQHPNVVQVFDVGEHDGAPFLVMELLRGRSLSAIARKARENGETIPLPVATGILACAARGLHAAHETKDAQGQALGIVHRDVSPQNIHVGYDGQVKVVDFGIAAARGRITSTRSGEVKGKIGFLSPEQVTRAHPVDRRADLWALGVVAWELLARRRLFRDEDEASTMWNIVHGEIPSLREAAPELPPALHSAIGGCLERDPWRRPESAEILARKLSHEIATAEEIASYMQLLFERDRREEEERLAAAQRGEPIAVPDATDPSDIVPTRVDVPEKIAPRRSRAPWIALGAGALALAAIAIAWRLSTLDREPIDEPRGAAVAREPVETRAETLTASEVRTHEEIFVEVDVDPRASIVLVDGVRHLERPVRVALSNGAPAVVEAIGPDGEIARASVAGPGVRVDLPSHAPQKTPRTSRRLLRNPD